MNRTAYAFDWEDYADGEHRLPCPYCGRSPKDKTAGLRVDSGRAVLHCFRCDATETFRSKRNVVRNLSLVKAPVQPAKHTTLSEWGQALWNSTEELSGVAVAYLEHRHCVVPPCYGDLRWHPALKHPGGHVGPALVALISHIHNDMPLSLHRTWITPTAKADAQPPRLLLANHTIQGGCIKLWPDEELGHTLGLAEGLETALSLAHAVQPSWSCVDAGHLECFPVLAGVTQIYIAADNDPAGIKAATACAQRWHQAGRLVEVSQQDENDINDLLETI